MKNKKKSRFINLAEQLNLQNEIVNSTMDSMLKFVAREEAFESRSDFEQIKKTAELNPSIGTIETGKIDLPRPKMSQRKSVQNQTEKLED